MGNLPIVLGARSRARRKTRRVSGPYRLRRWASRLQAQPLKDMKEADLVGEGEARREAAKLLARAGVAEQHRDAAAVLRAFDIDASVADKPHLLTRRHATGGEREVDRLGRRLVGGGVAGADNAAEKRGPAESCDFAPQQVAGLVADDAEEDPLAGKPLQHRGAAGQRGQPLEMDFP